VPIAGEILSDEAPDTVQFKVVDCPATILAGEAVNPEIAGT
jgi:hypothetical protein